MAIIAQDNFDSYTVGNDLNGQNGGSGYIGAWFSSPTNIFQVSNTQSNTLPNSITTINTGGSVSRIFGTGTTNSTSLKGKIWITSIGNNFNFYLNSILGNELILSLDGAGNVQGYSSSGGFVTFTSWTGLTGQWIEFIISYDSSTGKVTYSFNGVKSTPATVVLGAGLRESDIFHFNVNGYFDSLEVHDVALLTTTSTANPAFLSQYLAQQ